MSNNISIIDPHLHLFNRSLGDYHWLKTQNPPFWPDKSIIQQDFSIDDLNHSLKNEEIKLAGFVHIEAGFDNAQPWRELEYIASMACQKNKTIASIDLLAPAADFQEILQKIQQYNSLNGVRHILDEQAFTILASQNAQQNFARLNQVTDFIFELQLPLADENAIKVMPLLKQSIVANKQLRFIINHAGFPPTLPPPTKATLPASQVHPNQVQTKQEPWCLWRKHITELAKYPNVLIKCSGWEMADRHYQMSWFSEVTRFCIDSFSINRVMLASNFPLCLLGQKADKGIESNNKADKLSNKSYASYWQDILASPVIKQCSESEKSALLYNNALGIYKLY